MSVLKQYVQLPVVKTNGRIVALLLIPEPNSYVKFNGVALLRTDIGSISVKQVVADEMSVQGSKPLGGGSHRKFTYML